MFLYVTVRTSEGFPLSTSATRKFQEKLKMATPRGEETPVVLSLFFVLFPLFYKLSIGQGDPSLLNMCSIPVCPPSEMTILQMDNNLPSGVASWDT